MQIIAIERIIVEDAIIIGVDNSEIDVASFRTCIYAKFEGYLTRLVSDTGISASCNVYEGLEPNHPSSVLPATPNADTLSLRLNMTVNESFLDMRITDGAFLTSGNSSFGLCSRGAPSTITLTLQRAGW